MAPWISIAHSVAPIALGNSARMPSPAVSMTRLSNPAIIGRMTLWWPFSAATVSTSFAAIRAL